MGSRWYHRLSLFRQGERRGAWATRPGTTYTYDNNGNTRTKTDASGTTTYDWNYENRLTKVTLPNGNTVTYKYDPFGRRIRIISQNTTIYVYDGPNLLEEVNANSNVRARYTQGLGIDEPLAQRRDGLTHYYHADGLGSITSLSTDAGEMMAPWPPSGLPATYIYDSFGNLTYSTGSVVNPFRYTAREFDQQTGLYFYRARYYDPAVGRFLSEDPVGFNSGVNFYGYVHNNPSNLIDPTGLKPCCPKDEEQEIREEIGRIRSILKELEKTGTITVSEGGRVLGATYCQLFRLPNGMEFTRANSDIFIDRDKQPCIFKCINTHEAVHRRMCERLGARKYGQLTLAQSEIPAYTTELGCYINLLRDAGLNTKF